MPQKIAFWTWIVCLFDNIIYLPLRVSISYPLLPFKFCNQNSHVWILSGTQFFVWPPAQELISCEELSEGRLIWKQTSAWLSCALDSIREISPVPEGRLEKFYVLSLLILGYLLHTWLLLNKISTGCGKLCIITCH